MAQKNINIGSGALVGDGESIRSAFDKINQNFGELYAGEGTAEVNDLTQAVVWANVPDVNITQSSVTQHQAAITITESQISDLQNYLTSYTETNDLTTAVTWANVPDINITESSVTQHQAALIITESQISDLTHYTDGNVDTHLNTSTAIADQILAWNGTDYNWISQEEVDILGSFSVTAPAAAFGSGGIDYNSTNGQFTYTPPDLSNFLTAETDTFQTVTTRGATTTNEVELNGGVKTNNVQSANGVHSIGFNEANDLTIGSTGGVKIIGAAAAPLELGTETTGTVTIGSGSNNIVFASTIETNNITALPGDTDIYIQGGINSGTPGNPARVNIGTTNTSTIVLGASDSLIYVNGNDDSIISGGTGIFGTITGDLTGSVFSDDSTVMVDAVNNTLHASSVNAVAIQSSFLGNGGQNGPLQLSSGLEGQTGNSIFINPQGSDTFVQMWGETVNLVTGPYNTYDSPYMQFKTEGAFKAHQGAYFDGNLVGDVTGSVFADDSTLLVDGTNGVIPKAVVEDSTNWDTAFGWGDHAAVGYLTSETTTTLGINANILKYTDETGAETDIDLSLYLDDTNLARLTTGTLDSGTGIATFTRDDATTFTVDFSDLLNQAEANDLTASVTWANVPDANITESSVTQHQAALSITESQVSDLGNYIELQDISVGAPAAASGTGSITYDPLTGVFTYTPPDILNSFSVVSNAASGGGTLTYNNSIGQFVYTPPDLSSYLTAETNDLSVAVTWANVPDANITESSVTQHEAALGINESQITFTSSFIELIDLSVTQLAASGNGTLSYNNTTGVFTYTPPDLSSYLTDYTVTEADVTQHEAALSINESQIAFTSSFIELIDLSATNVTASGNGSLSYNNTTGVFTYTPPDLSSYLTSYTETNDLTSAVTWANVPDANITQSSVTQHQAALSITESQISDLGTYLTSEANDLTASVTWANIPDANVPQSAVTQHQAALSITESQISDLQSYLTAVSESDVTQHQAALSITESQISDLQSYLTAETNDLTSAVTWANVPDINITQSSVTQHQAALSITESQISDLGSYLTDLTGSSVGTLSDVDFNSVTLDGANGQDKVLAWDQTAQAFVPVDQTNTNTTTFGIAGNTGTHTFDMTSETLTFLGTTNQIDIEVATNFISVGLASVVNADLKGSVFADDSSLIVNGVDGTLAYTATTPTDWDGTAPTTVGEAIDRLAALVKTLNGGTGA